MQRANLFFFASAAASLAVAAISVSGQPWLATACSAVAMLCIVLAILARWSAGGPRDRT